MDPLPSDLFARRLRKARERTGVSARDLARRVAEVCGGHVDSTLIGRIEDQRHVIRLDEAAVIAGELGISLLVLISESPDEELDGKLAELSAERIVAEAMWHKADAAAGQARSDMLRIDANIRTLAAQEVRPIIDGRKK